MKLSYHDAERLKKMNRRELTAWVHSIYQSGYEDGYEKCKSEPGQVVDLTMIEIAIQATEGIGPKKKANIMENINKLCFPQDQVDMVSSESDGVSKDNLLRNSE